MFELFKTVHISCALLSVGGFALRGYWLIRRDDRLGWRMTRVLPHLVDTVLLASAAGMLLILQMSPFAQLWLVVKILALLLYIALGMVALRFGKTRRQRIGAFWLALATALYIIAVARSHSPWPSL